MNIRFGKGGEAGEIVESLTLELNECDEFIQKYNRLVKWPGSGWPQHHWDILWSASTNPFLVIREG